MEMCIRDSGHPISRMWQKQRIKQQYAKAARQAGQAAAQGAAATAEKDVYKRQVLIRNISGAADIAGAIWGCMGYTVLLCFCLFKTGSISKSVFGAHCERSV